MSNETKKRVVEILLNALFTSILLIAAGFGYNVTVLEPLITEGQAEGRGSGITRFNTDVQFNNSITVAGTVTTADLTASDDLAVTDALSAASFTLGGYAQSGAVRFGAASNVISGTTIAHGFGTTPTVFLIDNAVIQAEVFTQTVYAYGCGTVSCTVGLTQGSVVTVTTAFWMAGK